MPRLLLAHKADLPRSSYVVNDRILERYVKDAGLIDWCWTVGHADFGDYVSTRGLKVRIGKESSSGGRGRWRRGVEFGLMEDDVMGWLTCVSVFLFPGQSLSVAEAVHILVERAVEDKHMGATGPVIGLDDSLSYSR